MYRRAFIGTVVGTAFAFSFTATAQPTGRVRRIGFLGVEEFPPDQLQNIRAALQELGWVDGRNLNVESRYAHGNVDLLPSLAEELVRLKVELIVGTGTVASLAAKSATTTIPIVFYGAGDPVPTGLVASLARPGGNVTGITRISAELQGKRLQLLREAIPGIVRVGVLINSTNPVFRVGRDDLERNYRALGLQPIFLEVAAATQLESAVEEVVKRGAQALVVSSDPLLASDANWERIVRAAKRLSIPMMVEGAKVPDGVLISFAPSWDETNRQLAWYVDKILKGARPGDLPVEQPTRFDLIINLKTAKMYGITVPPSLLLRADSVIQ